MSDIVFANPEIGWAFGPGLWATQDGGRTWHATVLKKAVMVAPDGSIVYALRSSGGAVFVGALSGTKWTRVAAPSPLRVFGIAASRGAPSYVWGFNPEVTGANGGAAGFIARIQGGAIAEVTSPCVGSFDSAQAVATLAPALVAVLCAGEAGAGSEEKEAFLSTNGGLSFNQTSDPPLSGTDVNGLTFSSADELWLGLASGATLLYSAAGVGPWSQSLDLGGGGWPIGDLQFTDPMHGSFVFGGGLFEGPAGPGVLPFGLYLTSDGGAKWQMASVRTRN